MTIKELTLTNCGERVSAVQNLRGEVVSTDAYSQYNLCDYTGDDPLRVMDARKVFCQLMNIDPDRLVMPRQRHTTHVAVIDDDFIHASAGQKRRLLDGIDALVTNVPEVCIGVNTADCVPIVLADPVAGIVAVAHAGWRGTVGRIAASAVMAMKRLGAHAERISAAMGASICTSCFEVGDEVPQAFADARFDLDRIMHRNPTTGKAHIDLPEANRLTLIEAGLETGLITPPTACSRCNPNHYFSARRLGIDSGRTFTAIILRQRKEQTAMMETIP
ncbi:MAG: peptidoglycan editing factor PgeF [Muribaculaceae bacterium]|nr:peptidoglycan editing factor PgeF [Muribaculaceae bacterium]